MNSWLKIALCLCTVLSATSTWVTCYAQNGPIFQNSPQGQNSSLNWQNSPQNWRNSPDNWQNSSQNWQNSSNSWRNNPQNWENSPQNYNSTNGIYDTAGNRTGYVVPRADGSGINFFADIGNPVCGPVLALKPTCAWGGDWAKINMRSKSNNDKSIRYAVTANARWGEAFHVAIGIGKKLRHVDRRN